MKHLLTGVCALSLLGAGQTASAQILDIPWIEIPLEIGLYVDFEGLTTDTTIAGVTTNSVTENTDLGLTLRGLAGPFFFDLTYMEDETYTGTIAFGSRSWGAVLSGASGVNSMSDGALTIPTLFQPYGFSESWISSTDGVVGEMTSNLDVPGMDRLAYISPVKNGWIGEVGIAGDFVYGSIGLERDRWSSFLVLEKDRIDPTDVTGARALFAYDYRDWAAFLTYENKSSTAGSDDELGASVFYRADFGLVYALSYHADSDNSFAGIGLDYEEWEFFISQGKHAELNLDDFAMARIIYNFDRIRVGGEVWQGTSSLATEPTETVTLFVEPYRDVTISLTQNTGSTSYDKELTLAVEAEFKI